MIKYVIDIEYMSGSFIGYQMDHDVWMIDWMQYNSCWLTDCNIMYGHMVLLKLFEIQNGYKCSTFLLNIPLLLQLALLICHSGLGTENTVSQRIQTIKHKIGKMVLQWK